jgi:putative OPT family oligopeptide transporter
MPGEHGPQREFTARALAVGFGVGLVLTAAITYLALYSGLAISASIPGAMICTGVLRVAMKRATILENNLAQTIASSGEAMAVGIVFTLPALVLTGVRQNLDYWEVTLTAALGGVLGVLLTIPIRRALTVESPELRYPESVAVAAIVRAADQAGNIVLAASATAAAAVFRSLTSVVRLFSGTVETGFRVGGAIVYGGVDLSLALIGVGVIIGLDYVVPMMLGGVISWLVAVPLTAALGHGPGGPPVAAAWALWSSQIRFLGVGAMVVGGCWSVVRARHSISRGITSLARPRGLTKRSCPVLPGPAERPAPRAPRGLIAGLAATIAATFLLVSHAAGSVELGAVSAATIGVLAFVFASVSGYLVGFVGNSNNPVSGLGICAFLAAWAIFSVLGTPKGGQAAVAILLISAFACVVAATAGDTMQHLKTGAILGATPRRVQAAQLLGVVIFSFVVSPIVVLFQRGYGIGGGTSVFKAPQVAVFTDLASMTLGGGHLPRAMLGAGAAIAAGLILADALLGRLGCGARLPVMPAAIGMYLPLSVSTSLFLGAFVGYLLRRATRRSASHERAARDRAVLLSCSLITGEAIVGVTAAVLHSLGVMIPIPLASSAALSLTALALAAALLFVISYRATPPSRAGQRVISKEDLSQESDENS